MAAARLPHPARSFPQVHTQTNEHAQTRGGGATALGRSVGGPVAGVGVHGRGVTCHDIKSAPAQEPAVTVPSSRLRRGEP